MLWSLIKIVIFVALVAAATLGAGYLIEMDGGAIVQIAGGEYVLSPLKLVIGFVVLVIAVWLFLVVFRLLIATLKFLNGDETAISRYFDRNRERKGFQALSEGLMALASGEGKLAMAKASKAEKYLQQPELTNLITAQAAEMTGDKRKAEQVYKRLLANDATRFVGVRGLMKQKIADGQVETALKLAKTAHDLKPGHAETQDTLLQMQAQAEDWSGARKTLDAKLKYGNLPRDVHKRREAVLALSQAKEIFADGSDVAAREAAIEANRLSPDLIPAAVMAAHGYVEQAQPRNAVRVLKKAWDMRPHPDLARAFAAIAPDETPEQRIKRFRAITKIHPEHRETKLLLAEMNIASGDFPQARRALGDLIEGDGDARIFTIMAAIERGEGSSDVIVKGWLARALAAPRGPQWVCDKCNNIHGEWVPICDNCEALDTLSWTAPPKADVMTPTGMEMLPLIVGSIEDKSGDIGDEIIDAEEVSPDEERDKPDET